MAALPPRDPSDAVSRHLAIDERIIDWQALEQLVHCDPAGRGMASFRTGGKPLDTGQLRAAAWHLAEHGSRVAIVTGFPVLVEDGAVAETDGPPGALFLARALAAAGMEVAIVCDRYGRPLIEAGCELWQLDRRITVEFPFADAAPQSASVASPREGRIERWVEAFLAGHGGKPWSHLVAIERPGPSHTIESLTAQARGGPPPVDRFLRDVAPEERNACHDMRGRSIDRHTAPTHLLFDEIARRKLPITTIGIGDGGNEIGMGQFAWETVVEAVGTTVAGRIACRIATDHALLAGVSNWAAYALALAVARLRGQHQAAQAWDADSQRQLVETLVQRAAAVDGVTLRREPTVDGLPLDIYLETLVALAERLGCAKAVPSSRSHESRAR